MPRSNCYLWRPVVPVQWSRIALKGPDAADFLHRLSTVHVKALQPGHGNPGFLLTAQGKLRSYFHLWLVQPDEIHLEFDAGASGKWKENLLGTLDQFHFGEKFSIEELRETSSAWIFFDGEASAPGLPSTGLTAGGPGTLRFYNHGNKDFGKTWVSIWGKPSELDSWLGSITPETLNLEQVEGLRISATRPGLDAELTENTIPLEVGLKDAISDNKGCYPGQEVIERIVSLGSPARRLARLEGTGPAPERGEILRAAQGDQEIGLVTSVTGGDGNFQALALVKKLHAQENLEVRFQNHPDSHAKLAFITPYA